MKQLEKVKIVKNVQVLNPLGLHTRPATIIAQMLQESRCCVTFTYGHETINAKSVLGILLLAASQNGWIEIAVEGEDDDARRTMKRLIQAFEKKFGEGG